MEPWIISGAHHREVCALYDRQIRILQDTIAALQASINVLESATVETNKGIIAYLETRDRAPELPAGPMAVHRLRKRPTPTEPFDPSDPKQLFEQATAETGSRNASTIMRRMAHIRKQHVDPNVARTVELPTPNQQDVQAMIDNAEFEGIKSAHGIKE